MPERDAPKDQARARPGPAPGPKPSANAADGPRGQRPRATHDSFFKRVLSDPKKAKAFIRWVLPPKVAALLADKLPLVLSAQLVNGHLRANESDLRLRAQRQDGQFIDVNVEHKSSRRKDAHLQLYRYHARTRARVAREEAETLAAEPTVITLLAYHGAADWNPRVTLGPETAAQAAAKLDSLTLDDFRSFRAVFLDFKLYAIGELTEDPELQAALYAMTWQGKEALREIDRRLPDLNQHRDDVLTYIQQNWRNADPAVRAALDEFTHNRGDGQMETYWDAAVNEGFAKGEVQGREQGKEEGREEGRAELLLQLLRLKFQPLPAGAEARVSAASAPQLDAWAEALLAATSLDEVFARLPKP